MEICMHSSTRALENRTRRGGGSHEKVSGKLFSDVFPCIALPNGMSKCPIAYLMCSQDHPKMSNTVGVII